MGYVDRKTSMLVESQRRNNVLINRQFFLFLKYGILHGFTRLFPRLRWSDLNELKTKCDSRHVVLDIQ